MRKSTFKKGYKNSKGFDNLPYYKSTYLLNKTDSQIIENRVVVRGRGGKEWESGISRGKLLYIGWENDKFQLYSAAKYIQ